MTTALLEKISELRASLHCTPYMLMTFIEVEDELFSMECRILTLEEENQRLRRLLRGREEGLGLSGMFQVGSA